MDTTKLNLTEIKSRILQALEVTPEKFLGLRVDDYDYKIGDVCNLSHQLYQDTIYDTEDNLIYPEGMGVYSGYYDAGELSGTCAVGICDASQIDAALKVVSGYFGDTLYLIIGDSAEAGNDIQEIIISDAKVVDKWVTE